jgi:hypothetical protein
MAHREREPILCCGIDPMASPVAKFRPWNSRIEGDSSHCAIWKVRHREVVEDSIDIVMVRDAGGPGRINKRLLRKTPTNVLAITWWEKVILMISTLRKSVLKDPLMRGVCCLLCAPD